MKKSFLVLGFCLVLISCSATTPPSQNPEYFQHTVTHQGETLGKISSWYTGTSKSWEVIAKANPQINPNKIKQGDKIIIPMELVKKTDPLPKSYLASVKKPIKAQKKTEESILVETEVMAEKTPAIEFPQASVVPAVTATIDEEFDMVEANKVTNPEVTLEGSRHVETKSIEFEPTIAASVVPGAVTAPIAVIDAKKVEAAGLEAAQSANDQAQAQAALVQEQADKALAEAAAQQQANPAK